MIEIIGGEIQRGGPITLARFMELALYHPEFGYYEQAGKGIGKAGDFYTSVSVGPVFGELLAYRFAGWLERLAEEEPATRFTIVETGAHDGRLAADILRFLSHYHPALLERLDYGIVEVSERRRSWQRETLHQFPGQVRWVPDITDLPLGSVTGVIFGNELLDAFPAHCMEWNKKSGCWVELGVGLNGNGLGWQRLHQSVHTDDERLRSLPAELLAVLPDGFRTEVNPRAAAWWNSAAGALRRGWLMTLDYGLLHEEFFEPKRSGGTLRAFAKHHQAKEFLANPGQQDLTADVNFSVLKNCGEAAGLETRYFETQSRFLTGIFQDALRQPEKFPAWTSARVRQFQTLTHPEHLGHSFRVIAQSKNANA